MGGDTARQTTEKLRQQLYDGSDYEVDHSDGSTMYYLWTEDAVRIAAGVVEEATREADALRTAAQALYNAVAEDERCMMLGLDFTESLAEVHAAADALRAVLAGSVRGEPEETTE